MARLQILELPESTNDDRPPFVLVVDQVPRDEAGFDALRRDLSDDVAQRIGARAVLAFETTINIPTNDTTAYIQQVAEEVGSTLGNVTRAVNAQHLADERTDIARDMDRLVGHKAALLDALGMDRNRDWDDIRNAATRIRKDRDNRAAVADQVRQIHSKYLQDDRHEDTGVCNSDGEDWPCRTIQALNGQAATHA